MITTSQMYWITRLDAIASFGTGLIVVSIVAFLIGLIYIIGATDSPNDPAVKPMFKQLVKWALPFALLGVFVSIFVPCTKQMAAILIVPRIVNSDKLQQTGNKLYYLAVEWMDELKPKKGTDK